MLEMLTGGGLVFIGVILGAAVAQMGRDQHHKEK